MLERWRWPQTSLWSLAAVVVFALAAPFAASATCSTQEVLRVQLPRPSQPEYAGFVIPSLGYVQGAPKFSDECLSVMVQGGGTGFDPVLELTEGNVDLAIAEGSYVSTKVGGGAPLKVIAGYYQKNGLVWVGLKDRLGHIASVKDLTSKKIGTWQFGYSYALDYILSHPDPADPNSPNVFVTQVPQYPATLSQLEDGDIDLATSMVYDELARPLQMLNSSTQFLRQPSDLYQLDPADHGLTLVHNVLTVTDATLAAKRATIVKFLKVVRQSWYFCRANEAICAAAFSEYNVVLPHHLWQMREVNKFIFPSPAGHGFGVLSSTRWNAMNAWLVNTVYVNFSVAISASSVIDNSLVLEAGALDHVTAWTSIAEGSWSFCAEKSSTDYTVCQNYTYCLAGSEPLTDGTCTACSPGRYAPTTGRMNSCLVCPAGSFATQPGMSECSSCAPGRYWDTSFANASVIDCKSCPAGRFTNTPGASQCAACAAGFFSATQGAASCERCPIGRFMQQAGASSCARCQEGMATLHLGGVASTDCVCPKDTYETLASECLPCPTGMMCATNSKESNMLAVASGAAASGNYPRLRVGYWSANSTPLFVYRCRLDRACPAITFESCGPKLTGTACGQCQAGYYRDGFECLQCAGIDETAFNYPLLPIVGGPVLIFILYCLMRDNREDWGNWWNEIVHLTCTILIHYQIVGLLAFTFIDYPDKLASLLDQFTYLVDPAAMLRLSCSKYGDFRAALIVKETFPALIMALFGLTFCVLFVVGKIFHAIKYLEKKEARIEDESGAIFPKLVALCPMQADVTINLFLTVFNTFYVAICFMALQLFTCYQNPNLKYTILLAPEVTCYETNEWKGMLTEGIFCLLFYIAAPIAGCAYIVIIAPMRFHKKDFHTRWKCLFIKFKPDAYWWTVFQQLRILAFCLMLVLSQQGSRHAYIVFCLTLFYMALLVIRFPWRHRSTNLFDLAVSCVLLFFSAISATFADRYDWLDDQIAESTVVMSFAPLLVVAVLVIVVCWSRLVTQQSSAWKKANMVLAANAKAVFAKFVGLEQNEAREFCLRLSEQDRDILRAAVSVVVAEFLGSQPLETMLPPRLVHKERKAGARKWSPGNNQDTVEPAAKVTGEPAAKV